MARSDREKASDVFQNSTYLFAKKGTLEEAFPSIAEIHVHAKEIDYGNEKPAYWSGGEFVNCSNSLCYNGGFSVGKCVRSMVRDHIEEQTFSGLCQGYEGSPKGRRKYRDCMHVFELKIHISYKDESSGESIEPYG